MVASSWVTLAVGVTALLVVFRLILPNLLVLLGKSPLSNGYDAGPEEADRTWHQQLDANLMEEMTGLGFKPLGVYWEQMPLGRRFREYVFTRPGEPAFGVLYPNNQIAPRRASFLTVFESGAVAFTKNYGGGVEVRDEDFFAEGPRFEVEDDADSSADQYDAVAASRCDVAAGSEARQALAPLLEQHRENVHCLIARGHALPGTFDADEFCATQHRYYQHPRLRGKHRSSMAGLLQSKLFVLAFLPAVLAYYVGIDQVLPWAVLLAEGLVGLFLRYGCSSATVIKLLGSLGSGRSNCRRDGEPVEGRP